MAVERLFIMAAMLFVGFAAGILYFQGLWLTVKRVAGGSSSGGKLVGSFIFRLALLMAVFYFFMHHDWQRLIALSIGFWLARFIMVRRLGAVAKN